MKADKQVSKLAYLPKINEAAVVIDFHIRYRVAFEIPLHCLQHLHPNYY